jgi:hypothetical protein
MLIAGAGVFLILAIILLYAYHRKSIKKKNMDLFRQLKEKDQLTKELEFTKVEKKLLVNILTAKLDQSK